MKTFAIVALILMVLLLMVPVSAEWVDKGNHIESVVSGAKAMAENGNLSFTSSDGFKVNTGLKVDGYTFTAADKELMGSEAKLKSGEMLYFIISNPDVKITYDHKGNTLKETIVLSKEKDLSFPVTLQPGTKLIPWDNEQWKIVSSISGNTMDGMVAQKPWGIDAAGRIVPMKYEWTGSSLNLIYNKTITQARYVENIPGQLTREESYFDIQYPLTIDPTWTSSNGCWTASVGLDTVVKWNSTGTSTWTAPNGVTTVWYLVVAGAGGGGNIGGAGGGAGGLLNGTLSVTPGNTYSVTVGTYGLGAQFTSPYNAATSGSNSSFSTIAAKGGGMGGDVGATASYSGATGGSGGGGTYSGTGADGYAGQGNKGGNGYATGFIGGGGGGASAAGINAAASDPGEGGDGSPISITDDSTYYAGGGGGNANTAGLFAPGGKGGGGNSSATAAASKGADGLGGGGAGTNQVAGGDGGSGVVIIRYTAPSTAPVASFSTANISIATNSTSQGWAGYTPFTMQFTNTSTNPPHTSWVWNYTPMGSIVNTTFNQTTFYNPVYTFNNQGNYTISLNVTGTYGTAISTQTTWVNVTDNTPPLSITGLTNTTATNQSYISWSWTNPTNTDFNHTVIYRNNTLLKLASNATTTEVWAGLPTNTPMEIATHTVDLLGNVNSTWVNRTVTTKDRPQAAFTVNKTVAAQYAMWVTFNETNEAATAWNWSFGDGYFSTEKNTTHAYSVAGKYDVSLNITDAWGYNKTTVVNQINLTADSDDYLVSWLHFNGANGGTTFTGEEGLAWTPTSATTSTTRIKFGSTSGAFLSDNSRITTPHNAVLNITAGNFTIEEWVFPVDDARTNDYIISKSNGNAQTTGWALYHGSGTTNADWRFYLGNAATGSTGSFSLAKNAWSQVVVEKNVSTVTVYVNGAQVAYKTGMTGNYDTISPLNYGDNGPGIKSLRMYLDEARISNVVRYGSAFSTPYAEYRGVLETIYPDINPTSTMRFKTDPTGMATISNQTGGGYRNRTIQIQNVTFTNYILGAVPFDSDHIMVTEVNLNKSYWSDMTLVSYTIDNTIGPDDLEQYGLVTFKVTRAAGFAPGTDRASIIDMKQLYYNYTAGDSDDMEVFGSGFLINGTTFKVYPVHNFIYTPVTYTTWDFYPNFTANVTSGLYPLTVQLQDTTVGYPNIWNWSWGDGTWTNGTEQSPVHTYNTVGTYDVTLEGTLWQNLSVRNSTTKAAYITVGELAPVADFTQNTSAGFYTLNVQFNDTSINVPTAWNWSFGDGSYSEVQNATKSYSSGGNYTVNLTVHNTNATYSSKESYVEVWNHTTNDFTGTPVAGLGPLSVTFTDASYNATSWYWEFGNGNTSTTQSPTFQYHVSGTYTVRHSSANAHETYWTNKTDYITVVEPAVASFTQNQTAGLYVLMVEFTSTSTGTVEKTNWSFGDGSYSDALIPVHSYSSGGTYEVNLTVNNTYGASTKLGSVTVHNRTSTTFVVNKTLIATSSAVLFTDTSYNATAWSWQFGDGGSSTLQSPTHIYNTPGIYSINHSASNPYHESWYNRSSYVEVQDPPVANFSQNVTSGLYVLNVQFTDTSINAGEWNWSFGDGSISTTQSPTHSYSSGGTYPVNLTVNSTFGLYSTKLGSVTVHNRTSTSFTVSPTIGMPGLVVTTVETSANATNWYWEFGDGSTSVLQSPTHTYTVPGLYTINHKAYNPYHDSWYNLTNIVKIETPVIASFTATPSIGTTPLTVVFTESSMGTPTSWNWSFGDGTYSSLQNPPAKVFSNVGANTVTLRAWTSNSTNTYSLVIQVNKVAGSTGGTTPPLDPTVSTQAATNILQSSAVLHGNLQNPGNGWFIYGGQSNTYTYTTQKVDLPAAGDYYAVIKNGMYSNRTMYYRAVSDHGAGPELTFVVGQVQPVNQTNFGKDVANITGSKLDPVVFAEVLPSAFVDSFGVDTATGTTIFWGFIFLIIFIVLYIRSESVTTPALLGMVIGWAVMSFVPGEFAMAGQALLVVAIGAMGFTLIKGRIQ